MNTLSDKKESWKASEVAALLGAELVATTDPELTGISPLDEAETHHLSFLFSSAPRELRKLKEMARHSKAGAILVRQADNKIQAAQIIVEHPLAAVSQIASVMVNRPTLPIGIHPTAQIDPSAVISENARIGAFVVIGPYVVIGEETAIHPHVVVYEGAHIGRQCLIHAHAVIRERVVLGDDCVVQNGVVLGGDGFGYIPVPGVGLKRIPHIGNVILEDGVDIGANSTIDRATFGRTIIGQGTKIDNLVMVGHNVIMGSGCILCGQVGVAGSSRLGNGVVLGGQVGVADHIIIGDGVRAAAKTGIGKDIEKNTDVAGYPARDAATWRKEEALMKKLPALFKEKST